MGGGGLQVMSYKGSLRWWDIPGSTSIRLSLSQDIYVYISWIKQYPVKLLITRVNYGLYYCTGKKLAKAEAESNKFPLWWSEMIWSTSSLNFPKFQLEICIGRKIHIHINIIFKPRIYLNLWYYSTLVHNIVVIIGKLEKGSCMTHCITFPISIIFSP